MCGELGGGGLGEVDVGVKSAVDAMVNREPRSPEGDAHVALGVDCLEGAERDRPRLGRRRRHDTREPMKHKADAWVHALDELERADEHLRALLLAREAAPFALGELEGVGHGLKGLPVREVELLDVAVDELRRVLAGGLDDLLGQRELDISLIVARSRLRSSLYPL